jgi:lipoprotein-anchoring transpeptidase ErfK/SrfK
MRPILVYNVLMTIMARGFSPPANAGRAGSNVCCAADTCRLRRRDDQRRRFTMPWDQQRGPNPVFARRVVAYPTHERPGTIIIDPASHFLYFIHDAEQAIRYGVGVGREGFVWSGRATVRSKQEWPD